MKKISAIAFVIAIFFNFVSLDKALAIDTSRTAFLNNKNYNTLISDDDFISINAMSEADIQSFLVSKGSFLKNYSEGGRSAAKIIYQAAHAVTPDAQGTLNGIIIDQNTGTINPMAILVTLQKEQSLISATSYNQYKLDYAMGYGCLEDGSWNPNYKGFAKQVEWGAWQLRYNFHRAEPQRTNLPNYKVGQTMTLSNSGYSSISVTFANRATASLYRYTPHVFNGNYNFWYYFNTWFDASTIKPPPDTPNNTASVTLRTYSSSVVVGSTRSSSSTVSLSGATISYPDGNSWTAKLSPGIGTNTYQIHYSNGQIKPVTIIRHKSADINGDGKVDLLDLSLFGKYWNKTKPAEPLANLNPDVDEAVNILDLSILASNWSK